jgi:hypothetical protein
MLMQDDAAVQVSLRISMCISCTAIHEMHICYLGRAAPRKGAEWSGRCQAREGQSDQTHVRDSYPPLRSQQSARVLSPDQIEPKQSPTSLSSDLIPLSTPLARSTPVVNSSPTNAAPLQSTAERAQPRPQLLPTAAAAAAGGGEDALAGYSRAPKMVDPTRMFVEPISICSSTGQHKKRAAQWGALSAEIGCAPAAAVPQPALTACSKSPLMPMLSSRDAGGTPSAAATRSRHSTRHVKHSGRDE